MDAGLDLREMYKGADQGPSNTRQDAIDGLLRARRRSRPPSPTTENQVLEVTPRATPLRELE